MCSAARSRPVAGPPPPPPPPRRGEGPCAPGGGTRGWPMIAFHGTGGTPSPVQTAGNRRASIHVLRFSAGFRTRSISGRILDSCPDSPAPAEIARRPWHGCRNELDARRRHQIPVHLHRRRRLSEGVMSRARTGRVAKRRQRVGDLHGVDGGHAWGREGCHSFARPANQYRRQGVRPIIRLLSKSIHARDAAVLLGCDGAETAAGVAISGRAKSA